MNVIGTVDAGVLLAPWQGGGDQWKTALVGVGLGGLVLGLFGYLYFKEWLEMRRLKLYRMQAAAGGDVLATPGPGDGSRKVLLEGRGSDSSEAGVLSGMVVASARDGDERVKPVVGSGGASGACGSGTVSLGGEDGFQEIRVDGEFVGMTPARLRLSEGVHVVEVGRDGVDGYRREITVAAGCEVSLRRM